MGQLWGAVGQTSYLLEVVRGRYEAPELRRRIIGAPREWQPDTTVVEETELGRSLVQEIRQTTDLRPLLRKPRHSKEARLLAQAARFEAGQVRLPREAPWLAAYVSELLGFPHATNDDQVDATSLALNYLTEHAARERPLRRRNPVRRDVERLRSARAKSIVSVRNEEVINSNGCSQVRSATHAGATQRQTSPSRPGRRQSPRDG